MGELVFRPDGDVANVLASDVSDQLAASLDTIHAALSRFPEARLPSPRRATRAAGSPQTFAAYFDLLRTVEADDVQGSIDALDRVCACEPEAPGTFTRSWGDFSRDERSRMLRHLNSDPSTRLCLTSPSENAALSAACAIDAALALFDAAAPEISAEIRALVRHIVLVTGSVNADQAFDGATSFALWGAMFLNAPLHATRIQAVGGLSHECAHLVLFGYGLGQSFVENDAAERYASPLRVDPRPLDGIFHATFVSARLVYAYGRLLASGYISQDEAPVAERMCDEGRVRFEDGRATLLRHARLTPRGHELLQAASRFMDGP